MTRQIYTGYGPPARQLLDERLSLAEHKIVALTEAIQVLTHALADPQARDVGQAARMAQDLLISAHVARPQSAG